MLYLEDTLARRTFDRSGDYSVKDFDLDLREHLISGTNRGSFILLMMADQVKLLLYSPGKDLV